MILMRMLMTLKDGKLILTSYYVTNLLPTVTYWKLYTKDPKIVLIGSHLSILCQLKIFRQTNWVHLTTGESYSSRLLTIGVYHAIRH